jgi:hypothetical protein
MGPFSKQRYVLKRLRSYEYEVTDEDGGLVCTIKRSETQTAVEEFADFALGAAIDRDAAVKLGQLLSTTFKIEMPDGGSPFGIAKDKGLAKVTFSLLGPQSTILGYLVYQTLKLRWSIQDAQRNEIATCRQRVRWFGIGSSDATKVLGSSGAEVAQFRVGTDTADGNDVYDIEMLDPTFESALIVTLVVSSDFITPRS